MQTNECIVEKDRKRRVRVSALGCEYNNRNTQLERIISHHPTSTKLYIIENTQDMIRLICLLATTTMANTLPCPSGNRNGRQHFVILYSAPTFILLNYLLRTRIQLECGYQKRMNSDFLLTNEYKNE